MQLFAPAKIASMMQETSFAMDLTTTLGGIMVACAVLYAIPATTVLGAILVTGFWEAPFVPMSASANWITAGIMSLLLGVMTWGVFPARPPYPRHSASQPLVIPVLLLIFGTICSPQHSLFSRKNPIILAGSIAGGCIVNAMKRRSAKETT